MNRVFDPIDIVFIVLISLYLIVLITIGLILWYQKEQRDINTIMYIYINIEKNINSIGIVFFIIRERKSGCRSFRCSIRLNL